MNKQYKNFMEQQNFSDEINEKFYEKLENAESRRRPVRWNTVVAAACIALMIPVMVFAAEYIFHSAKVKFDKLDWYEGPNGYSIRFGDLDSFPLDMFPEELQTIDEHKQIPYESWEEAEEALGIDLLNNAFLANADKRTTVYDEAERAHSTILYSQYEGQLCFVGVKAYYRYDQLQLDLKAKLTVENSVLDEGSKQRFLGVEGAVTWPSDVEISYEEYTTKEGIPAGILRREYDSVIQYTAVFAVNDVSYELNAWVSPDRETYEKQILLDALDGFELK